MNHCLNLPAHGLSPNLLNHKEKQSSAIQRRKRNEIDNREIDGQERGELHEVNETHSRHSAGQHGYAHRSRHIHRYAFGRHQIFH